MQRGPRHLRVSAPLGWVILVAQALGAAGCGIDDLSQEEVARAIDAATLVERDRLSGHVQALVDVRMEEEGEQPSWGQDKPLLRTGARTYILDQLRASGVEPVEEVEIADGIESANILLDIPGTERPDELVIISAHYDSWYRGADDNASGIAVLLEAARVLAQVPPPARTIRLVAFDREEEGLLGSRRYVARHLDDRITLVINLDTVGYSDSTPGSQKSIPALTTPDTGDFLAVLGSSGSRTVLSQVATLSNQMPQPVFVVGVIAPGDSRYPGIGDLLRSDHAWFWADDVPAVFFADALRKAYGKLPVAGFPRLARMKKGQSRFNVVDPAGNWLRFIKQKAPDVDHEAAEAEDSTRSRLAHALDTVTLLRDFKGDDAAAAKILDAALRRKEAAPPIDRAMARAARAELAVALGDEKRAETLLTELAQIPLSGRRPRDLRGRAAGSRQAQAVTTVASEQRPRSSQIARCSQAYGAGVACLAALLSFACRAAWAATGRSRPAGPRRPACAARRA